MTLGKRFMNYKCPVSLIGTVICSHMLYLGLFSGFVLLYIYSYLQYQSEQCDWYNSLGHTCHHWIITKHITRIQMNRIVLQIHLNSTFQVGPKFV